MPLSRLVATLYEFAGICLGCNHPDFLVYMGSVVNRLLIEAPAQYPPTQHIMYYNWMDVSEPTPKGDYEATGVVDRADLDIMMNHLRNREVTDEVCFDFNGDKAFNIADARALVLHCAKALCAR